MHWPLNPFVITKPVETAQHFLGREAELEVLKGSINDPLQHVILLRGARRIGKSSMLKRAMALNADDGIGIYLDVRTASKSSLSRDEMTERVLRKLGESICNNVGAPMLRETLSGDPIVFQREFLQAAVDASKKRLLIFIDETEMLDHQSTGTVEDLLDAFQMDDGGAPGPLLVLSWGRPLGVAPPLDLAARLRGAKGINVESFTEDVTKAAPDLTKAYRFAYEAKDVLWEATRGHPYYVSAINHVVYEARRSAKRTTDVTADEILKAIPAAHKAIDVGLFHAWADQLSGVQSLLGRGLAEVVRGQSSPDEPSLSYCGRTTLPAIAERLAARGQAQDLAELRAATEGLIANDVLVQDGERYGLYAPFLGYWLDSHPYDALLSGNIAEVHRHVEAARTALAAGDRHTALAESKLALHYNPRHAEACIIAADLEEQNGNLDAAIQYLTKAASSEPENVRESLTRLLADRIRVAVAAGDDPRPWYQQLVEIDAPAAESPEISTSITQYYLDRWEEELMKGAIDAAASVFQDLAAEQLPDWRRTAAERYVSVLTRCLTSESTLRYGLAAVRDAFTQLTNEPFEGASTLDAAELQSDLEQKFAGDMAVVRELRDFFSRLLMKPRWWVVTIQVLDKAFGGHLDRAEFNIPVDVLNDLAFRAPSTVRDDLLSCYGRHLTPRLIDLLRRSPEEGFKAVRLLTDASTAPDLGAISAALDHHVLALETSDNDSVVDFFREGAAIYSVFLDAVVAHDQKQYANEVAGQLEILAGRMSHSRSDSTDWDLFIRGWNVVEEWQELLARPELATLAKTEGLRKLLSPPAAIMRAGAAASFGETTSWVKNVNESLQNMFGAVEELELTLPGIPKDRVRFYRGTWKEKPVNIKVYRLVSRNEELKRFLKVLWESERRVLFDVATRRRGRALTRLRFGEWPADADHLVVVTEPVGPLTLRRWLDRGHSGLASTSRGELWRCINSLIEGIASMHDARYLHRGIRPESIFLTDQALRGPIKIGNFEWSFYVHSIADRAGHEYARPRTFYDRYSAPEVLNSRFGGQTANGENFGSDVYSLGLVLFELLVRRLREQELGFYPGDPYDFDEHCRWLDGLREEVRQKVADPDERLLLLEMLHSNVERRMADLNDAAELSRRLAHDWRDVQQQLTQDRPQLITTLFPHTDESIRRFLERLLDISEVGQTPEDLGAFVAQQLAGARIFRNGGNPARPLVIEGTLTFTVRPFQHNGATFNAVPYLTVANSEDIAVGPELGCFPSEVDVIDLQAIRLNLDADLAETLRRGDVWRHLFELAAENADDLPPRQREFHSILRVTSEVERALWDAHVVPFKRVSQTPSGQAGPAEVVIEANGGSHGRQKLTVAPFVQQQLERVQQSFELGTDSSPVAGFADQRLWNVKSVDLKSGQVVLKRTESGWEVPGTGFLRPETLKGNRAIYTRRQELLRHLEDDLYLLTAVTETSEVRASFVERPIEFRNDTLDADKKRIVERIRRTRPLFALQGPPGTGKTTLAAEIIQQMLAEDPCARVLIASQAHDPLNNLLLRVDEGFDTTPRSTKPLAVRILRDDRTGDADMADVIGRFHPAKVAERCLLAAKGWHPSSESRIDEVLLGEWRALAGREAGGVTSTMKDRIISSANLVYVTANDRSIANLADNQTFDLLIFEEAAKAYPLEVLAPMRLARRWLLIGDQDQLPPFNREAFMEELVPRITAAVKHQDRPRTPSGRAKPSEYHLALDENSAGTALQLSDFFAWLHAKGTKEDFADRLTRQWRMHPDISAMLKATYYDLSDGDPGQLRKARRHRIVKPDEVRTSTLVWIDTPPVIESSSNRNAGSERAGFERMAAEKPVASGGYQNRYECEVILEFLKQVQLKGYGGFQKGVAFLSPYFAQVRLMTNRLQNWEGRFNPNTGDLRDRVFTVDSFQGRQADVIIVSLVRNNAHRERRSAYGFLESKQRAGVMFSRAESLLVVVGCSSHFMKHPDFHISGVFRHIQKHGTVLRAAEVLPPKAFDRLVRMAGDGKAE